MIFFFCKYINPSLFKIPTVVSVFCTELWPINKYYLTLIPPFSIYSHTHTYTILNLYWFIYCIKLYSLKILNPIMFSPVKAPPWESPLVKCYFLCLCNYGVYTIHQNSGFPETSPLCMTPLATSQLRLPWPLSTEGLHSLWPASIVW